MKKLFVLVTLALTYTSIYAQAPDTVFTRCYGGSLIECNGLTGLNNLGFATLSADIGSDSSVFIVTSSLSSDGYVNKNNGDEDIWVLKLNPQGDTLWTKVFGGSQTERSGKILALPDGGCIITGRTFSNDGDFTNAQFGVLNDAVVIRLDANGSLVWKKRLGGSQDDLLHAIALNGNGFIAVGETGSVDGDLDASLAGYTCGWIVSLNANGDLLWSIKTNGVIQNEDYIQSFWNVAKATDGSGWYAIGITGDFADPDSDDILFTKFDNNGSVVNKTAFGSNKGDGIGGIAVLPSGNLIMAGRASNATGGQTYIGGAADAWLVTVDVTTGLPITQKLIGGTEWESFYDVKTNTLGEVFALGFTRSTNNFASTTAFGLMDSWLVKLTPGLDTVYTSRLGGNDNDVGMALCKNASALYAVGRTNSNNGAVSGNNGTRDVWVIKYAHTETGVSVTEGVTEKVNVYPNPTNGIVNIVLSNTTQRISLYSQTGQLVATVNGNQTGPTQIDATNLAQGVYMLWVQTAECTYRQKLIVH
ncbi:MAG: T9SS type A sorting domain-containing protein [Sphingobacteriales bacterium JAD_PAG50586_3]|nr:MAG: T9SS type A sorting domain-containing protein [Sphingobacteriales bacterium JAD_PAG50586_3]